MKTLKFKVDGRKAFLVNRDLYDEAKKAFSFSAPSARFSPAHRQWQDEKREGVPENARQGWDGRITMFKDGAIGVGAVIGSEKDLAKEGLQAKILKRHNIPHVSLRKGFTDPSQMYEHQNQCVTKMLESIKWGGGLVLSATGTGKTKIAAQFASWVDGKILFVVDQIDLLYQSQIEIQMWLKAWGYKKRVGVVGNSRFEPEDITVATIQTLQKFRKSTQFRKWTKSIDIVIIDEIHVQMSRRNFDVVANIRPQAVFGLTATMQLGKKEVRLKCLNLCGQTIFEFPIQQGAEKGVLVKGVVVQGYVDRNSEEPKYIRRKVQDKRTGRWSTKEKVADDYEHQVVYNKNLNRAIASIVKDSLKQDYAVVVLVERIRHLKKLAKRLRLQEPKLCYGGVEKKDRRKTLKIFDQGKVQLIIANKVFTKGINLKRVDLIIDAAQRKNKNDCVQKYGRGVRLHQEKDGLIYISLFTEGYGEKAATSQRGAFKKIKIPIVQVKDADLALQEGQALLRKTLKTPVQGKLFG